jgi:hypothetical protein
MANFTTTTLFIDEEGAINNMCKYIYNMNHKYDNFVIAMNPIYSYSKLLDKIQIAFYIDDENGIIYNIDVNDTSNIPINFTNLIIDTNIKKICYGVKFKLSVKYNYPFMIKILYSNYQDCIDIMQYFIEGSFDIYNYFANKNINNDELLKNNIGEYTNDKIIEILNITKKILNEDETFKFTHNIIMGEKKKHIPENKKNIPNDDIYILDDVKNISDDEDIYFDHTQFFKCDMDEYIMKRLYCGFDGITIHEDELFSNIIACFKFYDQDTQKYKIVQSGTISRTKCQNDLNKNKITLLEGTYENPIKIYYNYVPVNIALLDHNKIVTLKSNKCYHCANENIKMYSLNIVPYFIKPKSSIKIPICKFCYNKCWNIIVNHWTDNYTKYSINYNDRHTKTRELTYNIHTYYKLCNSYNNVPDKIKIIYNEKIETAKKILIQNNINIHEIETSTQEKIKKKYFNSNSSSRDLKSCVLKYIDEINNDFKNKDEIKLMINDWKNLFVNEIIHETIKNIDEDYDRIINATYKYNQYDD